MEIDCSDLLSIKHTALLLSYSLIFMNIIDFNYMEINIHHVNINFSHFITHLFVGNKMCEDIKLINWIV